MIGARSFIVCATVLAVLVLGPVPGALAAPTPGTVGPGSSDAEAVVCIQRALGVDTTASTPGTYGPATMMAVRDFQVANGLPSTGAVGPRTGALLVGKEPSCAGLLPGDVTSAAEDRSRSFPGCPLLLEGRENDCIARLQRDLNQEHPEYALEAKGVFGPNTRKAVLDFQGRHRLPADGNVGADTADLLASLSEGPALPRPPATGARVVTSPDIKTVRYLQVGTRNCIKDLTPIVPPPLTRNVPAACALLDISSNPSPPASLEGPAWKKFVDAKEFRGFSHIPPMQLTCHDGRIGSVDRQPGDTPFGVSQGWTYMNRHGIRYAEHAEWFEEDARFHPEREDIRTLADGSGVVISARQASRIAAVARAGQFDLIGYDAPFIWSATHVVLRCDGSARVIYGGSTIPGTQLFVGDRATSTIDQSDDLASFVRAGGRIPHLPGHGDLYDQCEAREVDLVGGSDERAITSCSDLQGDGGVGARASS